MSERIKLTLRPVSGEAMLSDPAVTGIFASEMAEIARLQQTPPWCGFIGWIDDAPTGFAGFKGPPDAEGQVEIGYLTFPDHQGKGIATAMAEALVHLARSNQATLMIAHTLPAENASTAVLIKNGFSRVGESIDPDEGVVWRWALVL